MSARELVRVEVLGRVKAGSLPLVAAATLLGVGYRQAKRLWRHFCIATGIIFGALALGVLGYHTLEKLSWLDSLLNASMILSGMGPLTPLQTSAGKLFAGAYALFSGLAIIVIVGVIFAPVVHRFLHKFHLESGKNQ